MDWSDKAARDALRDFRHGRMINGGTTAVYEAVAQAIREGGSKGFADALQGVEWAVKRYLRVK